MWVSQWNGTSFVEYARAGENTWVGDGDSSQVVELPCGFKGAVGEFHGVTSVSYQNSVKLLGFSEEELSQATPKKGWDLQASGMNAEMCVPVLTFGEYLKALAHNGFISIPIAGVVHPCSGNLLATLPFAAGDQAARHYVVISPAGIVLREARGCGDRTPYILPESTTMDWTFSDAETDNQAAAYEAEERLRDAIKEGGAAQWVKVTTHLRAAYREGVNPLPTLRKKYPGTWMYYAPGSAPGWEAAEGEVRFSQYSFLNGYTEAFSGWQVSYIPA